MYFMFMLKYLEPQNLSEILWFLIKKRISDQMFDFPTMKKLFPFWTTEQKKKKKKTNKMKKIPNMKELFI